MKRLDQILSQFGICSRRETRYLIRDKRVTINGELARKADQKVSPHSVCVDDESLDHPDGILVMLHKPLDYVCTHDDSEGLRIYDLLPWRWGQRDPQVVSIGRLDKDTSGLILITDNSALVHSWTSPKAQIEKVYRVQLDQAVSDELVAAFAAGVQLRNEPAPCLPAKLQRIDETTARVTISEGKYHQVRRMFAACGLKVEALHREQFGAYALGDLEAGQWRDVSLSAPAVTQ